MDNDLSVPTPETGQSRTLSQPVFMQTSTDYTLPPGTRTAGALNTLPPGTRTAGALNTLPPGTRTAGALNTLPPGTRTAGALNNCSDLKVKL